MSELELVMEFHDEFGFTPLAKDMPAFIDNYELAQVRANFLQEELDEYCKACGLTRLTPVNKWYYDPTLPRDLEQALDGLIDLAYVLYGTVDFHGMNNIWPEAFERVHAANMAKVRVNSESESKRGTTIDVRKPEGWVAPTFADLLGQ